MRSKHYIYEIFGRKIGATNDVERRMKQQDAKEGEYRIIEEHTNAKICSIREIELQREHNYPVDKIQYWKTLSWQKKSSTPQAQKKRIANTDFKASRAKIDWVKKVENTDYKAFQAKKVANTNWEARTAKIDYKAIASKIDYKAKAEKCKKSVNQYDLEGNLIKQWDSVTTICQTLWGNMSSQSNITNCCRGKYKTAKKSIWKYAG
jgi:hypothetical protein